MIVVNLLGSISKGINRRCLRVLKHSLPILKLNFPPAQRFSDLIEVVDMCQTNFKNFSNIRGLSHNKLVLILHSKIALLNVRIAIYLT